MAQKTMYAGINNSVQSTLTAAITATDSTILLASVDGLPAAPNLITIGTDDDAEVVRYNGISGLQLTGCERGFDGTTAKVWLVDELVYRAFTKYDHDTFKDNIEDLESNKLAKTGNGSDVTVTASEAASKANLATGEKLSVLIGKLMKWYSSFGTLTWKSSVAEGDITAGAVSNQKLADAPASTLKGNKTGNAATPGDLTATEVRTLINVSNGADVTPAAIDAASAETTIADSDKIPFIDVSASGTKLRTILWSKIKEILGPGIPTGGTANQVLTKNSSTDHDASWKDASGGSVQSVDGVEPDQSGNVQLGVTNLFPTIKVSDTVGASVTAVSGSTTLTGTIPVGGSYTFSIPSRGTWTISDGTFTKTVKVEQSADYEVDLRVTIMGVSRSTVATATGWSRTDEAIGKSATASIGTSAGSSDFDTMPIFKDIEKVTLATGDVMVKIPKFWYKRYRDANNIEYIKIADKAADGFALHPAFLRAGVTYDNIYVAAYKTTASHFSKSGLAPLVSITRAAYRTGARAKGTGWGIIDLAAVSAIEMLILVEFANNNVQSVIGEGFSNGSAAKATGTCDSVPGLTGRPAGTANAVDVVWRGIEGFWGNVWEWTDGLNINNGIYYVANDPSVYEDNTATGYDALDFQAGTAWSSSYITAMGLDADAPWAMMPSAAGSGSATTYYPDGAWSATGWRVFKRGGSWAYGSLAGLFAASLDSASSGTGTHAGSRLLYLAP